MNLSGTLNAFRLLHHPTFFLPHHTIPTFDSLPLPPFPPTTPSQKAPSIRALVLDKDNCFAAPKTTSIHPPYVPHFARLRSAYRLLIVSNTAGSASDDPPHFPEAARLEHATGVPVLRHGAKKPGCHAQVLEFLRSRYPEEVRGPENVAIVGDRLMTDVLMGNLMGAWTVWVRDGVVEDTGLVSFVVFLFFSFFLSFVLSLPLFTDRE